MAAIAWEMPLATIGLKVCSLPYRYVEVDLVWCGMCPQAVENHYATTLCKPEANGSLFLGRLRPYMPSALRNRPEQHSLSEGARSTKQSMASQRHAGGNSANAHQTHLWITNKSCVQHNHLNMFCEHKKPSSQLTIITALLPITIMRMFRLPSNI